MKIGLIIIVASIVWYIVHAMIYNHYLQKNNPELFDEAGTQQVDRRKNKEVQVVITRGETPAWVMLMGMAPIPLFLLGILITIIGFIISLFK